MSEGKENDNVRPEVTTQVSLTLRVAGSQSGLPTLGANVSFVGGADIMFAPEPRWWEGHSVVWVGLRRRHIDPGGVSPFNATWQRRWEKARVNIIVGQRARTKKKPLCFCSNSQRGNIFTVPHGHRHVWLIAQRFRGRSKPGSLYGCCCSRCIYHTTHDLAPVLNSLGKLFKGADLLPFYARHLLCFYSVTRPVFYQG